MAKQMIIGVLEDLLGEYILNISKENLKIAAVRGKIKLENIELDGDLIGSHILGAVGLSGFAVLSCWARSLRITVPWANLAKDPTRFEIRGMHLVCVPLSPTSATRMCGSGTALDPRCTLRTRAKRSALARLERNFFAGRVPGEGPPPCKENAAASNRNSRRRGSSNRWKAPASDSDEEDANGGLFGCNDSGENNEERFSEARRSWKTRIKAKIFRNIEASVRDIHLRCEVPEGGLDVGQERMEEKRQTFGRKRQPKVSGDKRAFAFGVTLESLVVRTATDCWEDVDMSSSTKGTGSQANDNETYKLVELNNLSIYWDDAPPFLVSECNLLVSEHRFSASKVQARIADAMQAMMPSQDPGDEMRWLLSGKDSTHRINTERMQSNGKKHDFCCLPFSLKLRATFGDVSLQGPPSCVAELLSCNLEFDIRPHQYQQYQKLRNTVFSQQRFDTMLHQRPNERPSVNPRAWWKYAIACVSTQSNSRPWRDVIRIVRSRSRYVDLVTKKILKAPDGNGFHGGLSERESIDLLELEDLLPIEALLSFHLLALRRVVSSQLPEAAEKIKRGRERSFVQVQKSPNRNRSRSSLRRIRRAFGGSSKAQRSSDCDEKKSTSRMEDQLLDVSSLNHNSEQLYSDEITDASSSVRETGNFQPPREEDQPMQITFILRDSSALARLLDAHSGEPIVRIDFQTSGSARMMELGVTEMMLDVKRCDVCDCSRTIGGEILTVRAPDKDDECDATLESKTIISTGYESWNEEPPHLGAVTPGELPVQTDGDGDLLHMPEQIPSNDLIRGVFPTPNDGGFVVPPIDVVCRVSASVDHTSVQLQIWAHPATLVWNQTCMDSLADFFSSPAPEMQSVLRSQLRDAATPLAHRAQLAFMSPQSVLVHINVDAPKLWIPVSSNDSDGALYLDAGRFNMVFSKPVRVMETSWEIHGTNMQVKFIRGVSDACHRQLRHDGSGVDECGVREEITVVRPFYARVDAHVTGEKELTAVSVDSDVAENFDSRAGVSTSKISVSIGKICFNLVDVDTLARAIGKWYAAEIVRVRRSTRVEKADRSRPSTTTSIAYIASSKYSLSVCLEKIECALEGHSTPAGFDVFDSTRSEKWSRSKRSYLVEIFGVEIQNWKTAEEKTSRFAISNISVHQMKEYSSSQPGSIRYLEPSKEPHHHILSSARDKGSNSDNFLYSPGRQIATPPRTPQRCSGPTGFYFDTPSVGFIQTTPGGADSSLYTTEAAPYSLKNNAMLRASHTHDGPSHLDEVEIDVESVMLRITPTSLRDCARGLQRIFELAQLMTKEMERRVHEEGRKARIRDRRTDSNRSTLHHGTKTTRAKNVSDRTQIRDRAVSPVDSLASVSQAEGEADEFLKRGTGAEDSSILFKVTIKESMILAGRPATVSGGDSAPITSPQQGRDHSSDAAVVQIVFSALIMFQSIENQDASGVKTIHVSINDLSATVNTIFEPLSLPDSPPNVGPVAGEFRVVYQTENMGIVVSQQFSLDIDSIKSCLTPNDMEVFTSVTQKMFDRLRPFGRFAEEGREEEQNVDEAGKSYAAPSAGSKDFVPSFVRFKKKGSGIATRVRVECQVLSFVLLRASHSKHGARPLFDFNSNQIKGRFEGCMSAMSGECSSKISVNFFNTSLADWEYAVEPFRLVLAVEQMPNELILMFASPDVINMNLTGVLLHDVAEMEGFGRNKISVVDEIPEAGDALAPFTPSVALSAVPESHSVSIINQCGLDVFVGPMGSITTSSPGGELEIDQDCFLVTDGTKVSLDSCFGGGGFQRLSDLSLNALPSLVFGLAPSAESQVGKRKAIFDLPVTTNSGQSVFLHKLLPFLDVEADDALVGASQVQNYLRKSPDIFSDASFPDDAKYSEYYNMEPVVEWAMQNARLRANSALEKGKDILSSIYWSPGDELFVSGNDRVTGVESPDSRSLSTHSSPVNKSNWLRPYLNNDSPEWTDMTCILRMARDRVMLPDDNWIWLNDWAVDVSGAYGDAIDADGWEYTADFETFDGGNRRFYERGDACRRRRWTRTRMVIPPRLDDPKRILNLVWETKRDGNGHLLRVRSPLTFKNETSESLTFFVFSYSWDKDEIVGTADPGGSIHAPIQLSPATHLRLAVRRGSNVDFACSERLLIVPTSHTSTMLLRTSICFDANPGTFEDRASPPKFFFLVSIQTVEGITDVTVEPVLKIVNLLPCRLQCHLSETIERSNGMGRRLVKTDEVTVDIGEEGKCVALDCRLKPHISLRLPGYKWSKWQRIVNRKANSHTWQPSDEEEELLYEANKEDADHTEEYKTVVKIDRKVPGGDPLVVILSVEAGHSPLLRVYAQYWIIDKTSFGLRFSDGFSDILGTAPASDTSRRSYLLSSEKNNPGMKRDLEAPGHEWSFGMNGMSLYFSRKEKLALSIECGDDPDATGTIRSKWTSLMDISNVMPKTVFSVDERDGSKRFELAFNVTLCPAIFSRTKLITLCPRYQVVNLLKRGLFVAQDGYLSSETFLPSQASVPFHWDSSSLPPKIRFCAALDNHETKRESGADNLWTNGSIQLDKVGITSMRLPMGKNEVGTAVVIQVEVRLATKEQNSAVVAVIWSTNEASNPLYLLKNRSSCTILCSQPLHNDADVPESNDELLLSPAYDGCSGRNNSDSYGHGRERNKRSGVLDRVARRMKDRSSSKKSRRTVFDEVNEFTGIECGSGLPILSGFVRVDSAEEYVWRLPQGEIVCFGFDDPERAHVLEWTCVDGNGGILSDQNNHVAFAEVDAMGSCSVLALPDGRQVECRICAEHSTKVIEFVDAREIGNQATASLARKGAEYEAMLRSHGFNVERGDENDDEVVICKVRVDFPGVSISVVDNAPDAPVESITWREEKQEERRAAAREILFLCLDSITAEVTQSREGYHELELRVMNFQVDNHVYKAVHPVLVFCPRLDENEPFLHMAAVRRLQPHSITSVFRYCAVRILQIDLFLDRRTAEVIARFIQPLRMAKETYSDDPQKWIAKVTTTMSTKYSRPNRRAPRDIEQIVYTANSGRIYFEHLHLHPIRLSLSFTQEWTEWNPADTEGLVIFQFIRGMASISKAPLTFTSFVVSHAFESPQALLRIVSAHYSSQLLRQVFGIIGSLAVLGPPADFLANVGTGVRDFFYEPINGLVHGPRQFIEGLEVGTQSLARGVFVGVVRGAATVTEVVNHNLAGLTDDVFIDERNAHQRLLLDAMSRGAANRTIQDSLFLAGASVARGVKSGAMGIVEQPTIYASKHGPVGFVKGVGKALVGAIVKPVVGVGDAAVLVMNHVSDATSDKEVLLKIPKRNRRALPRKTSDQRNSVQLLPYDEGAAKAQKIVTGGENVDDAYMGHVQIPSHLIIASEQCLWAIDRRSRSPWCVSWDEVSHFGMLEGGSMRITVFSQTGLKSYVFSCGTAVEIAEFYNLLSINAGKMGNCSSNVAELDRSIFNGGLENISTYQIPGIKTKQVNHVFGSCNQRRKQSIGAVKDEIDVVEQCFARVQKLGSEVPTFFRTLDEEAWSLVDSWRLVFSGLSSRRCIAAGIINGTGAAVQIKSTKLVEGGSPCYSIPTREFEQEQGILHAGGAIVFFGWGAVPSLLQAGRVFMRIETNAFVCDLSDKRSRLTYAVPLSGYQVGYLEKSYDENGWWAKYWLLVRRL